MPTFAVSRRLAVAAAGVLVVALTPSTAVGAVDATPAVAVGSTTEKLDRGLISVRKGLGNFVSWRLLSSDPAGVAFNVYRDGTRVTRVSGVTSWLDTGAPDGARYVVAPVVNGAELRSSAAARSTS